MARAVARVHMMEPIRERLNRRRIELLQRYASELERGEHEDKLTPETVDLASEQTDDRLLDLLEGHDLRALQEVVGALKRLDDGSYGMCLRCGEAISTMRLEVLPTTRHCITCASWLERHPDHS